MKASALDVQNLFYQRNLDLRRYYAESNINILLIRNVSIDSGVRQESHPLMIDTIALFVG